MDFELIKERIDRQSPVPLYYQLEKMMLEDLNSGKTKPGTLLPTEIEIGKTTGLSRSTVRQALSKLVSSGYLVRKRSAGTFVAQPKLEANYIQKLESFRAEMIRLGIQPDTYVIRLEKIPGNENINCHLDLDDNEPLIVLERLSSGNGVPIVHQLSYLPGQRFEGLIHENMNNRSLYNTLSERYKTTIIHVHRQIEAVNSRANLAQILKISTGQALCRVENIAYDQNRIPVEYNISHYRGDRNKFTMDLFAPDSR